MIKTVVPDDLQLDPVTDNLCLAIKITSDADDTTANVVTQEVISCDKAATTTHYMCRFNYIANSIVYIDESRDWNMAMGKCQEIGGELFSMKNNEEKAALNCLLRERYLFYLIKFFLCQSSRCYWDGK